MSLTIVAIVVLAIIGFFVFLNINNKPQQDTRDVTSKTKDTPIKSSHLLTEHEKTMFGEIEQAVPECRIFVQVALGAILWTSSNATRNKFNRLIADFVITDRNFNILAIIELDDKSHDNKKEKDAKRDAMVSEAGYKKCYVTDICPTSKS